jgi:multidrug efflux pump subunit AcrA (membrane-fusion protein)
LLARTSHPALSESSRELKSIVAPARSHDIAPPFDGQVVEKHFLPGQWVKKGALLFTITSKEELELERDQAVHLRAEPSYGLPNLQSRIMQKKAVVSERQYLDWR